MLGIPGKSMSKQRWPLQMALVVVVALTAWSIETPLTPAAQDREAAAGHGDVHAPVPPEYANVSPLPSLWTDDRMLQRGKAIYSEKCAICHGDRGDGRVPAAVGMRFKPPDFTQKAMAAQMTDAYSFWRVSEGGVVVEPFMSRFSVMPAFKDQLSVEERWAVIAYQHSFSGHRGPHVAAEHPEQREMAAAQAQDGAAQGGMPGMPGHGGGSQAPPAAGQAQMGDMPPRAHPEPRGVGFASQWVTRDARWQPRGVWKYAVMRDLSPLYREFNGIDFGHAHLGETLLKTQDEQQVEQARLEVLDFIFSSPPVPPDEEQVAPTFNRIAWEVAKSFNWTHSFHRSLYDLFASDKVTDKEGAYRRLLADYLDKPEAITPHRLDHHGALWSFAESKSFRDRFRKFNTQIWAYHWLQAAVYDVQLLGGVAKQQELMPKAITFYHGYLRRPPVEWQAMPMMAEGAPNFSKQFPEAAAIFDNLHMLHDNMDDILVRPDLYPTLEAKRAAMLKILPIYLHRNHGANDLYTDFEAKPAMPMGQHGGMPMHGGMQMMDMGPRPPSVHEVMAGTAPPSDQPQSEPKVPSPAEKH